MEHVGKIVLEALQSEVMSVQIAALHACNYLLDARVLGSIEVFRTYAPIYGETCGYDHDRYLMDFLIQTMEIEIDNLVLQFL